MATASPHCTVNTNTTTELGQPFDQPPALTLALLPSTTDRPVRHSSTPLMFYLGQTAPQWDSIHAIHREYGPRRGLSQNHNFTLMITDPHRVDHLPANELDALQKGRLWPNNGQTLDRFGPAGHKSGHARHQDCWFEHLLVKSLGRSTAKPS